MDNLQLRQRIVRSMIRVSERTANMRKPEKFEYRKHMTAAFMDMLELCIEANRARGSRRVELQNKMDTKLDVLRSLVDTAVSPEDRLISPGLHEIWSKELNEIGRMLGGWKKWYYLKLDVSKYFYRVDHRVLLDILRRKFPNEDGYLWLMETIINCDHTPFGLPPGKSADEIPPSERLFEVGMPIGNLTSQLLANVCLNELDQYIKHELKAHFYDRYMDDMALLYPDAATLNRWRAAIEKYLNEVLHLELNSKTTIGLVKHGITFVGCRIYPGYRKPTAQSVKKMKARMRYIAKEYEAGLIDFDAVDATMQSYFGLMGHCSTHGLQKWIEKNIIFKRKEMADIELPQEVTQWELNQF